MENRLTLSPKRPRKGSLRRDQRHHLLGNERRLDIGPVAYAVVDDIAHRLNWARGRVASTMLALLLDRHAYTPSSLAMALQAFERNAYEEEGGTDA